MIQFLVALALCYVLIKIPFWILGSLRGGGGRSMIGGLVRAFIAYKTFGLVGGGGRKTSRSRGGQKTAPPPDPYAKTRAASDGQYMLPLNVTKVRKPGGRRPAPQPSSRARSTQQGKQLAFPLDGEWPENKPRLSRNGQYRLPLDVQRRQPSPHERDPASSTPSMGSSGARQPALFTRAGTPVRAAMPPTAHPGAMRARTEPGQQSMLPIIAGYEPGRQARRSLHDDPTPPPPQGAPTQDALLTRSGRIRAQARPKKPVPQPTRTEPGGQYPLPLRGSGDPRFSPPPSKTARPRTQAQHREPAESPRREVRGQQALFHRSGQPTARAMPGTRARRTTTPTEQAEQPDLPTLHPPRPSPSRQGDDRR